MTTTISRILSPRNITVDIVIFVSIFFIPALSHVAPFPLYLLDPMRILLFAGYLLSRQNANTFILAVAMPLFSSLVTGHPPFFKALLISVELVVNIFLLVQLIDRTKLHLALSLFLSMIASKLVYYGLKSVFIYSGLIEGELITTNLWIQLGTVVFITLTFYLVWTKTGQQRKNTE
ncbi:MAG: hypothetical protein WC780_07865 [Lentimicrobiaceae bacterium]|jgi:hypothetical protein